jgi:hypothetical protein
MTSDQDCTPNLIVHRKEWPGGLRCGGCHRKMHDGERYAESLTGMAGSIPVVTIVCCACNEGQHTTVTG